MSDKVYRLCYVDPPFAYFTTQELSKQWGDDWNDAPYEHNAGRPYDGDGWEIVKIAYEVCDLETPADKANLNSNYSVEMINNGAIAWLSPASWSGLSVVIPAGASITFFVDAIYSAGGVVYIPMVRKPVQR